MKRTFFADYFQRRMFSSLSRHLAGSTENFHQSWTTSSAVVFSPHFDDETLGCGGTIINKIRAGARLQLVFMTDGSTSHSHLISKEQLNKIRSSEGLAAAQCLGIKTENVFLLNIPEGQLERYSSEAGLKVRNILKAFNPDDVYIPHQKEPLLWSADHIATNRIVMRELQKQKNIRTIWEYPIWYWFHWPWVRVDLRQRQYTKIILKNSLASGFGLRTGLDLNFGVPIKEELGVKMQALMQHRSQMTRLIADNRWATLNDVAGGDFVKLFFRKIEFFRRTQTARGI